MTIFNLLFSRSSPPTELPILKKGAVIIDVRTPREFKVEHIEKSYNFPLNTLTKNIKTLQSFHKPLVIVCASEKHAQQVQYFLTKSGIECHNFGTWQELSHKLQEKKLSVYS